MHMADALLSPAVAGAMYACSFAAAGYALQKVKKERDEKILPVMGVMGAFVFAAQMLNFTIPGTGSSGHLCGGLLLAAVVGPYAAFLTMIGVLLIQCLLFADGGLLALGANIWNMAFYGCFVGGGVIWALLMQSGVSRTKITLASVLGCVASLQLGAFSVSVETLLSGITELPFAAFLLLMQPIHLAIGAVEGAITAAVLLFLYAARPSLLWGVEQEDGAQSVSFKNVLAIMSAASLVLAGGISLLASELPDGLEWSLERMTGSTELESAGTSAYAVSEAIQSVTALLPDYNFAGSESAAGTSFAGIVGAVVVMLLVLAGGKLLKGLSSSHE
mgnify:FL=1